MMNERLKPARALVTALLAVTLLTISACTSNEVTTGLVDNRLAPCPKSPNCVSSDATDEEHRVEPYRLKATPQKAWHGLQNIVAEQERITLITVNDSYLHVEVRSAVFRFVDDLEFQLRASEGVIAVRSAARTGYGDMGVNRKRVETIREALIARQLVE